MVNKQRDLDHKQEFNSYFALNGALSGHVDISDWCVQNTHASHLHDESKYSSSPQDIPMRRHCEDFSVQVTLGIKPKWNGAEVNLIKFYEDWKNCLPKSLQYKDMMHWWSD